jgi:hypothetical protein
MPGKVLDAIQIIGAANIGSTLDVTSGVTTSTIKLSTGATVGKYLKCTNVDGTSAWDTVTQEEGMKFNYQTAPTGALALTKAGVQAVVVLAEAQAVTLPEIDADVQGRMYLIINTHSATNSVTAFTGQKIDSAGNPGSLTLPASGGKVLLVAGTAAQGWFTI